MCFSFVRRSKICGVVVLLTLLQGCAISMPFRSTSDNAPTHSPVVVSITHAVVKAEQRAMFDDYVNRVLASLPTQPGLLRYSVRRQIFGNEVWTLTVWKSNADRAAFVGSSTHANAMSAGIQTLKSARFHHFERASNALAITWKDALSELAANGRSYDYANPQVLK